MEGGGCTIRKRRLSSVSAAEGEPRDEVVAGVGGVSTRTCPRDGLRACLSLRVHLGGGSSV